MAKPLRKATTPIGVFTRHTDNDYKFVGVWRWHPTDHEYVKWSRTAKGASTQAYMHGTAKFYGPYPVDPLE